MAQGKVQRQFKNRSTVLLLAVGAVAYGGTAGTVWGANKAATTQPVQKKSTSARPQAVAATTTERAKASTPAPTKRATKAGQRQLTSFQQPGTSDAVAVEAAPASSPNGSAAPATKPTASAPATIVLPTAQPLTQGASDGAAGPMFMGTVGTTGQVELTAGKSMVLTTRRRVLRVSVGQPDVVTVNPISPTTVLLTGKAAGQTQIIVWDEQDQATVLDASIAPDDQRLRDRMKRMFPGSQITVEEVDGIVVLRGQVADLETAKQAAQMAGPPEKVLNQLVVAGGKQVMLQVRVAEVSRNALTTLGVNLGATDGVSFAGSNIGQVSPFGIVDDAAATATGVALGIPNPAASVTLFGKGEVGRTAFAYFLNALRQNNLLRILAEPNLVAVSGEEASFLAGGEFPIPVTQGGGGDNTAITIEYREFGVKLDFVAVALGSGRWRLKCAPEVSDLDFTTAVQFGGFVVPGLNQRRVSTTVELAEGQSLAIAGLLNDTVTANKDVTPLLGDLPILGTLFRSVRYQRRETELVVFVTPVLASALDPEQVTAVPGEHWRHPSERDIFLKQDIGGPAAGTTNDPRRRPPLYYGAHGFAPPPAPKAQTPAP